MFCSRGEKISPHSALLSAHSISRTGSSIGIKVRDVLIRGEGVITSGIVIPASCSTLTFPIDEGKIFMNAGSRIIEFHFLSRLTDHVNGFQDRLEEMNMHTLLSSGCSLSEKKMH